MSEPIEVRVARLEEKMNFLVQEATEAKEARKLQYQRNDVDNLTTAQMVASIKTIEEKLAGQAPTIEEFITIKHKVTGAGILGKWVWGVGGAIIALLFSARETIGSFIGRM